MKSLAATASDNYLEAAKDCSTVLISAGSKIWIERAMADIELEPLDVFSAAMNTMPLGEAI